ncbi:MAG: hypothetical protein JWM44_256 [Bacilli bacterium]|nr:hypothetical protein [Bacilli bacterium]
MWQDFLFLLIMNQEENTSTSSIHGAGRPVNHLI